MLLTSDSPATQQSIVGVTDADQVEALRAILGKQQCREVGYDEARDIGASLVEFYQVLAEEVCDESED